LPVCFDWLLCIRRLAHLYLQLWYFGAVAEEERFNNGYTAATLGRLLLLKYLAASVYYNMSALFVYCNMSAPFVPTLIRGAHVKI
jgi:hypothetical protein